MDHYTAHKSHFFYPGLLFMSIAWVQSQMVRLLVLRQTADESGHTPEQLWYDETHWYLWHDRLKECHRENFSIIATHFMATFTLTPKETTALHCLVCMRNMLAHAALSWYALTEDRSAPVAVYVPRDASNQHCRCCLDYPKPEEAAEGVTLSFDEATVEGYLARLDTVTAALQCISKEMGLEHIDLR